MPTAIGPLLISLLLTLAPRREALSHNSRTREISRDGVELHVEWNTRARDERFTEYAMNSEAGRDLSTTREKKNAAREVATRQLPASAFLAQSLLFLVIPLLYEDFSTPFPSQCRVPYSSNLGQVYCVISVTLLL